MRHSALYAGTFDPITLGHLDLMERASRIFERVIIAVVERPKKKTLFTARERAKMVKDAVRNLQNVQVEVFNGLLVDYARQRGISVLVRGLRAYSDFEYEFQMALTNRKIAPNIETLFLMPKETFSYLSSSVVREVAELGGDLRDFVPACAIPHVRRYLGSRRRKARAG
jgi:pantetheine-phosphate adenylyltransferase